MPELDNSKQVKEALASLAIKLENFKNENRATVLQTADIQRLYDAEDKVISQSQKVLQELNNITSGQDQNQDQDNKKLQNLCTEIATLDRCIKNLHAAREKSATYAKLAVIIEQVAIGVALLVLAVV